MADDKACVRALLSYTYSHPPPLVALVVQAVGGKNTTQRRDILLSIQAAAQARWSAARVFEEDAPDAMQTEHGDGARARDARVGAACHVVT